MPEEKKWFWSGWGERIAAFFGGVKGDDSAASNVTRTTELSGSEDAGPSLVDFAKKNGVEIENPLFDDGDDDVTEEGVNAFKSEYNDVSPGDMTFSSGSQRAGDELKYLTESPQRYYAVNAVNAGSTGELYATTTAQNNARDDSRATLFDDGLVAPYSVVNINSLPPHGYEEIGAGENPYETPYPLYRMFPSEALQPPRVEYFEVSGRDRTYDKMTTAKTAITADSLGEEEEFFLNGGEVFESESLLANITVKATQERHGELMVDEGMNKESLAPPSSSPTHPSSRGGSFRLMNDEKGAVLN